VEWVSDHWRAKQRPDLHTRHADGDTVQILSIQEIALLNRNAMHTSRGAQEQHTRNGEERKTYPKNLRHFISQRFVGARGGQCASPCVIMAGHHTQKPVAPQRPPTWSGPSMKPVETDDLRKAGLKVTIPRLKILEILGTATPRHMSAEDIYKHLLESHEDIGLATVYRVLTQFEAAGLVSRHHFEGTTAVFELNEGEHHDHIVCLDCGKVEEFMDSGIEERQRAVASKLQFEIKDHSMILYGRCKRPNCPSRDPQGRRRI
jgi:Fur family transcriptional regulator, ferric uptake regulator